MRLSASLGPQHVCVSVSEVSWSHESQPAAAPHSIISALLMKEWPSEKSHQRGWHRLPHPQGSSLETGRRRQPVGIRQGTCALVLAPEGQATVFGRPHSGPLCRVCVTVGVGMREG